MKANETKVRIELSIPGDDGHVNHRALEALAALGRLGFVTEARLDQGRVFILADTIDPVDSSTVDDVPGQSVGINPPHPRIRRSSPGPY